MSKVHFEKVSDENWKQQAIELATFISNSWKERANKSNI